MKYSLRGAIWESIYQRMEVDPTIFVIGEGAKVKMSFDCPKILNRWPERVITAPIAEAGIVNVALGASLNNMRPIVDLTFNDLTLRAAEEIVNEVAKTHFLTGGKRNARVVIKADFNRPENAQSGNRLESMFVSALGLRIVVPTTPSEADFFAKVALTSDDPFLFYEDRIIDCVEEIDAAQCLPFGKARHVCRGDKLTLVTYGYGVQMSKEAIRDDDHVDLIDLRSLNPIDWDEILESVQRTRRLLIVEAGRTSFGVGAEVVSKIVQRVNLLRVARIGARDSLIPADPSLQAKILPTITDVRNEMDGMLKS